MTRSRCIAVVAAVLAFSVVCVPLSQAASPPGDTSARADEISATIERLTADAAAKPDDAELRVQLGNAYYESGLLDQALESYLEAVRIDSLHVGARLNLAAVYADKGESTGAISVLETAQRLDPSNPMVVTNLGSTYYWMQRYGEAVDLYLAALALDPNYVEARFNLAVAFADAQIFDEAVREWRKVIELAPESEAAKTSGENIRMIEEFRGAGR